MQDLDLQGPAADAGDEAATTRSPNSRWIIATLLAVLVAATSYIVFRRQPLPPPAPAPAPVARVPPRLPPNRRRASSAARPS